jgi:hypothetical protein
VRAHRGRRRRDLALRRGRHVLRRLGLQALPARPPKADAQGRARFETIYPGWYRGRTPHIHLKVHVGGSVVHTGQVFFDEKTTAAVYRHTPYRSHGQPDTSHAEDMIYAQAGRSRATLKLTRRSNGRKGYRGSITLGVAT